MYKILLLIIIFLIYYKKKYNEKFITGLPKRAKKAYRNYNIKVPKRDINEKTNKNNKIQKLINLYLNEISEPLSYNNNILQSSIKLDNSSDYYNEYNNMKNTLKLQIDKKTNIKKFKKNQKLLFTKNNAIDIAKNFVIKFNNVSNFKIEFVKILDIYKRRLINNNNVQYIITFYVKKSDYKYVFQILLVCEINKKNEIIYNNKFDDNHITNILNNIIVSHLIGTYSHSDILFGSQSKYNNYYKYQIDYDNIDYDNIDYDNNLKILLNNKKIEKDNENNSSIYKKYNFNEGLIKLDDKCIDNVNNKWILNDCNKTRSIFIKDENDHLKFNNNYVLSYHNDNNLTYSPYNSEYICNNKNDIQNCNKFKFKKFSGLEIMGLNNKCLNYKNNKWSAIPCKDAKKVEFIKKEKENKIDNNIKGKIKIKDKCLYIDNKNRGKLVECRKGTNFIHKDNKYILDKNKCLTFYHNGKINTTDCKIEESCKNNNLSQICKKFKFENMNGFKILGRDKCLNSNLEEKSCINTDKAEFIIN